MKDNIPQKEMFHWRAGAKRSAKYNIPPEVLREIEIQAVNRYRRKLTRLINRSNATREERSRFGVILFSVVE